MLRRSRLVAPLLLGVLAFAPVVRAAQPSDLERARALFDEAGELEKQGNWNAAQDRLRDALHVRETPHLRYALGWALENGDKLLEARTEYEVALRLAQRGGVEEVSKLASTRIAEVDRKIPLVQIKVRGALAKDTRVLVDGREVIVHGEIGTVPVDPGKRTVRVERAGKSASEETVAVTQGVFRVVEVQGDESAVLGGESSAAASRSSTPVLPWALIGAGGAAVIGGVVLVVASSSDISQRDASMRQWCDATACSGTTATVAETPEAAAFRRDAYDAASRGNTKQVVGAIVGGVGIASIALGTYLLVKNSERADAPRAARASALRLDASPLPGGAMAGAALTF